MNPSSASSNYSINQYEIFKIKDIIYYNQGFNFNNSIKNITKQIDKRLREITIKNDTLHNFSPDLPKNISPFVKTRARCLIKNKTRTKLKPKTLSVHSPLNTQYLSLKKSTSGKILFHNFITENNLTPVEHVSNTVNHQKKITNQLESIVDNSFSSSSNNKSQSHNINLSLHQHYHKGIKRNYGGKSNVKQCETLTLSDIHFDSIEENSTKINNKQRPYSSILFNRNNKHFAIPHPLFSKINLTLEQSVKIKNDLLSKSSSYSYYTSAKALNDSKLFAMNAKCHNKSMDNINILVPLDKIPKKYFIYKYGYFISTNPKYKDFLLNCKFISNITPTNSYKFRREIGEQILQMAIKQEKIDNIKFIPKENDHFTLPKDAKSSNTHIFFKSIVKQAELNIKHLKKLCI